MRIKTARGGKIAVMPRRILIFPALPYANGDIHLGHLVEYIQADIWARYHKLRGRECYFICADDAHGTPVMLRAESEGVAPEALIARMRENHLRDFSAFHIKFDRYHSTHSPENEELSAEMFRRLRDAGCIAERRIRQLYDAEKKMFLPDRYVRGECPKCGAGEQYGDSCERCGAAYSSAELKNPRSVLSGAAPVWRESLHYFLRLNAMRDELREWTQESIPDPAAPGRVVPRLQKEAANKMREWLESDLRDWDISRDPPYFGFRIPDAAGEKYFYVWLDAPIGYMAGFRNFCADGGVCFDDFWRADSDAELYHFIGKDILYFHALFWPAMLKNAGWRRPTRIFAHGFLTVNGEKMSKSRGTFVTAGRYLECGLDPEFLRYYYASKLGDRMEDLDLNLGDFAARANGDLVGKLINIPSRVAGFLSRFFDGELDFRAEIMSAEEAAKSEHYGNCYHDMVCPALAAEDAVAAAYENRRYHDAMRTLMRVADNVNAVVDAWKPWQTAKDENRREELHEVCSAAMRAFHLLMVLLQPVLPKTAAAAAEMLNAPLSWGEQKLQLLPAGHKIGAYRHLLTRMPESAIRALIAAPSTSSAAPAASVPSSPPVAPEIGIDDFARVDLRTAAVLAAEEVDGADKLLKLILDAGDGRRRQVFAGIKKHCNAADLVGRRVLYLSNLKTRKMRFGDSEGMVLAAADGEKLWLISPPDGAPPGARVR
ncbi:MAG: methionine--tRNA ligase [Gammaproteobacteria bacterium]